MMHLKMNQKATKANKGKVVVGNKNTKAAFYRRYLKFMRKKLGNMPSSELNNFMDKLADSLNLQLMNCPLDLFVEHIIYTTYKQVRPLQLLSLIHSEFDNIKTVQNTTQGDYLPPEIVKANKVMILVSSMHLKEMYGIDFISEYHPTKFEYAQANDLLDEFKAYLRTYEDGDEFEMLEYFVQALHMEEFVELQNEAAYASAVWDNVPEEQPSDEDIDVENAKFALEHQDGADELETRMMSMYMLGAMETFDKMPLQKVRNIAMEMATVSMSGINPKGKYSIASMPGKEFGGYQFLAYYYVSLARTSPEILKRLGLPFDKAYENALALYRNTHGDK